MNNATVASVEAAGKPSRGAKEGSSELALPPSMTYRTIFMPDAKSNWSKEALNK
jgi:hypothetical protein